MGRRRRRFNVRGDGEACYEVMGRVDVRLHPHCWHWFARSEESDRIFG